MNSMRVKAQQALGISGELTFASEQKIADSLDCPVGSLGPVGIGIPVIVDHSAAALSRFLLWR